MKYSVLVSGFLYVGLLFTSVTTTQAAYSSETDTEILNISIEELEQGALGKALLSDNINQKKAALNLINQTKKQHKLLESNQTDYATIHKIERILKHAEFAQKYTHLENYIVDVHAVRNTFNTFATNATITADADVKKSNANKLLKELIWRSAYYRYINTINIKSFELGFDKSLSENAWFFLQDYYPIYFSNINKSNDTWLKTNLEKIMQQEQHAITNNRVLFLALNSTNTNLQEKIIELFQPFVSENSTSNSLLETLTDIVTYRKGVPQKFDTFLKMSDNQPDKPK